MRIRTAAAVSVIALVSGCTSLGSSNVAPSAEAVRSAEEAQVRADVNPDYRSGAVKIPTKPTASLEQAIAKTSKITPQKKEPKDGEDRLRMPAMREAAIAYGARAGLAYTTREINKRLVQRSAELTRTYDFQNLMIQGPDGVMIKPPVIVEATEAWESFDDGKTLRVADTVYEIVEQAHFTSVAPMWQGYLISDFEEAETPPDALLPRDSSEQANWKKWVEQGWRKGQEQAEEIFKLNLNRLNRDFQGMVRYRALLEEGKVSAPIVAEGNLGNTGTGLDMRVNDRAIRITRDPLLQIQPTGWSASATTTDENGNPVGPEKPAEEAPSKAGGDGWKKQPSKAPSKPRPKPAPAKPAKPVVETTSGGSGRF